MSESVAMSEKDFAKAARDVLRWILTVGAAIAFPVLVYKLSQEVWNAEPGEKPSIGKVRAGVIISLSVTFGSAFVGWFESQAPLPRRNWPRLAGTVISAGWSGSSSPLPARR
jgi:hypothetical protein